MTKFKSDLFFICTFAFILRIAWALIIPVDPVSDSYAYDAFAKNILQHGTYGWTANSPTSFWPVGTSALYSLIYYLFGTSFWSIVGFNILCSLGIIIYSYHLCLFFFNDKRMAIFVSLIISCWPTLIFFTTILASELPYTLAILASIFHLLSNKGNPYKTGLISGLLFSAAYYIRPLAIIVLAICLLYLFLRTNNIKDNIIKATLCFVTIFILVLPWAVRNFQIYGNIVTMSTNGGVTFWMGNSAGTKGGYKELPETVQGMDEYTRNVTLKEEAIAYIKQEPLAFVTRTFSKFLKFHSHETIGVTWNIKGIEKTLGNWAIFPLKIITQLYWMSILTLALFGLLIFIKQHGIYSLTINPLILFWLATSSIHAIIVAQDRYHLPITPFISCFAALAIIKLDAILRKSK